MKKFMVLVKDDEGNVSNMMFNTLADAEKYRATAEMAMGWYAEVYVRTEKNGYVLSYC